MHAFDSLNGNVIERHSLFSGYVGVDTGADRASSLEYELRTAHPPRNCGECCGAGRTETYAMPTKFKLIKSPNKAKKWRAVFTLTDGSVKKVDFGAAGYEDYTMHKDAERKARYMNRHKARENWKTPYTAGSLSRWILWNKPSLRASVADFKRKFKLQ